MICVLRAVDGLLVPVSLEKGSVEVMNTSAAGFSNNNHEAYPVEQAGD